MRRVAVVTHTDKYGFMKIAQAGGQYVIESFRDKVKLKVTQIELKCNVQNVVFSTQG